MFCDAPIDVSVVISPFWSTGQGATVFVNNLGDCYGVFSLDLAIQYRCVVDRSTSEASETAGDAMNTASNSFREINLKFFAEASTTATSPYLLLKYIFPSV